MPRRRAVRSLQRLCLENVALNMEGIWAKHHTAEDPDQKQAPCAEGPFSMLAGFLVHELLQLMGEGQGLSLAGLRSLLVPQLRQLDFSSCPELVSQDVLRATAVHCTKLTSLNLHGCSNIPAASLAELVKGLPRLTALDLSRTQCDVPVLTAVATRCRRIRELDLSGCNRLSPGSLLYLAYDPGAGSYCCPRLQALILHGLLPSPHGPGLVSVLAFLLLAWPCLRVLVHEAIGEAVRLIYCQRFDGASVSPGFPSLEALLRHRESTHVNEAGGRLTLPLREIFVRSEAFLPVLGAMCPQVEKLTLLLEGSPGLGQAPVQLHRLSHLSLLCMVSRDLRDLLPVMRSLKGQLQSLSFTGFLFQDKLSFHALLGLCLNLRSLRASFTSPRGSSGRREPGEEALACDLCPAAYRFPHLCHFSLMCADLEETLPSQHAAALRASLVSLLKHAPCLETLELIHFPFSLNGLLEEVLQPPGTALLRLREFRLIHSRVSARGLHLLLSSDNRLNVLILEKCLDIHRADYEELLRRIQKERFELRVVWL